MPPTDGAGFGVYVHWPFCASKCPYCDFNSHVRSAGIDEPRFLSGFRRELSHMAALAPGRRVSSVFFGGGTPSLMSPATVGAILDAISGHWEVDERAEITLEANPSSVEANRFRGYRASGVNRVSLGVQALNDADLKALGRLHTVAEVMTAIDVAQSTFTRMSFDLIYARPGQTPQNWRKELTQALSLARRHLSLYQLTIEQGTPFAALHAAGRLKVPEAELADGLYEITQELTEAAGLPAYEISNHAAPGEESRHNLVYWRYGEYAGVGPGAHGRLIVDGVRRALTTERQPERWLAEVEHQGHGLTEDVALTRTEQADELLLMGLRLAEGVDLARLAHIGGAKTSAKTIAELVELGMLEPPAENRLRATRRGRFVLNELVRQLSASLVAAE
ncbi:MAG: radical SAM family heme chaperone HemW [Bacteroidota bacterium]|jgi:oxygen-independent coproporphyrinogen-3 oxidase